MMTITPKDKRILIDVDGVIADSHAAFIRRLHHMGYDDVSISDIIDWDFGLIKNKTGYSIRECIRIMHDVWLNDPEDIKPVDESTPEVIDYLLKTFASDIVTANPIPTVRPWLDHNKICSKHFIVADIKTDLDHMVMIEDNPTLNLKGHILFLRDRDWNRYANIGTRFYNSTDLVFYMHDLADKGILDYRK